MTLDAGWVTVMLALIAMVGSTLTACFSYAVKLEAIKSQQAIMGQLTELLELTRQASRAQGVAEEKKRVEQERGASVG